MLTFYADLAKHYSNQTVAPERILKWGGAPVWNESGGGTDPARNAVKKFVVPLPLFWL